MDQEKPETAALVENDSYDLVVIGAGIAGLNALAAASEYLPRTARVLLLDQKEVAGGMWNTAYDYVRLHQPHPMFTVGDLKWNWHKPRDYLAARDEVRDHLAGALASLEKRVSLTARFGQTAARCEEVQTPQGPMAEIAYHPNGSEGDIQTVRAKRAISASGLNYAPAAPLELSSPSVISIIPQDLRTTLDAHPAAPLYVVGGGKTGMDTILTALAADPGRKVTLINGRGTNFVNRTRYLPSGLKRWTSGKLVSSVFRDLARHFDGDNEEQTLTYLRTTYSTNPQAQNGVFLYGLQSEEEFARVQAGLAASYQDYLQDVSDTPGGPELTLRSGAAVSVPEGSIFVNCTGSFFRNGPMAPKMPIISENDCVLSINPRDAFHFLTSVAGFFGPHLLYRNLLRGSGFYTLDLEGLFRKNRNALVGASAAQAYLNQLTALQTLPITLLDRCGLDLDRWYPLPRRMAGLVRMKANAAKDIAYCRRVLDRVAERFDVQSAELR